MKKQSVVLAALAFVVAVSGALPVLANEHGGHGGHGGDVHGKPHGDGHPGTHKNHPDGGHGGHEGDTHGKPHGHK